MYYVGEWIDAGKAGMFFRIAKECITWEDAEEWADLFNQDHKERDPEGTPPYDIEPTEKIDQSF